MPVSEEHIQVCRRVCQTASRIGVRIREFNTVLGRSFSWHLPDGKVIDCSISHDRKEALLIACQTLLPHIFAHV